MTGKEQSSPGKRQTLQEIGKSYQQNLSVN